MTSRKRLAWLLWFALLLPFAQLAAAAHELGHLAAPAQVQGGVGKAKAQAATCEVCLVAAAVDGGGAAQAPMAWAAAPVHFKEPGVIAAGVVASGSAGAFLPRAPPSA